MNARDEYDQSPVAGDLQDEFEKVTTGQRSLAPVATLPPDLMLLKMENESIMAVAQARPRNPKLIIAQLKELIDAYPEAADEAIYVKPVGTEMRITCGGCGKDYVVPYIPKEGVDCPHCKAQEIKHARKVKKFAEGLSIRAAESIRSIYGYNRLSVTMESTPDGKAKISGVFIDYGTGTMTADTRIVSPFYTDRQKRRQSIPEDRFLNVTVKAEKSKLRRDIILDSVPNVIKAAFRDLCEKKLTALVSEERIKSDILPWFASKGLTLEHLEKIIGRPVSLGWTEEDRTKLRQIASALKNEETTVAELIDELDIDVDSNQPTTPTTTPPKSPTTDKPPKSNLDDIAKSMGGGDTKKEPTVDHLKDLVECLDRATSHDDLDGEWSIFFETHTLTDPEMIKAEALWKAATERLNAGGNTQQTTNGETSTTAGPTTSTAQEQSVTDKAKEFSQRFKLSRTVKGCDKVLELAKDEGFSFADQQHIAAAHKARVAELNAK